MNADKTLRELYGKMKKAADEFNAYAETLASMSLRPPLLPITPGWYETRGGDKLQVLAVYKAADIPLVVMLDPEEGVVEYYHADGMMCHLKGEQACDLIKRTTAPEGGES